MPAARRIGGPARDAACDAASSNTILPKPGSQVARMVPPSVRAVATNAPIRSSSVSRPTRSAACRPSPRRSSSCGTHMPVMGVEPVPRPLGPDQHSDLLPQRRQVLPTPERLLARPAVRRLTLPGGGSARSATAVSRCGPSAIRRRDRCSSSFATSAVHPSGGSRPAPFRYRRRSTRGTARGRRLHRQVRVARRDHGMDGALPQKPDSRGSDLATDAPDVGLSAARCGSAGNPFRRPSGAN